MATTHSQVFHDGRSFESRGPSCPTILLNTAASNRTRVFDRARDLASVTGCASSFSRVLHGSVTVDGEIIGRVQRATSRPEFGIAKGDQESAIDVMAQKVAVLRVFEDDAGKMNKSLVDVSGGCLVVSQFTAHRRYDAGQAAILWRG